MKEDIEKSSGNLYADLEYKNPEEMEAKALLAREIYRIIKHRKLSQSQASKLLGVPQPALCKLLQGRLSGFSTDRLIRLLKLLGQDIDITIKPTRKKHSLGILSVHTPSTAVPLVAKGYNRQISSCHVHVR